jgi:hypothetical protein
MTLDLRSISTPHYHLWTDALHARQLARETQDEWDRGSYVRWTIQAAWTAFEATCEIVLRAHGLGMRFKERFDQALKDYRAGLTVDWGKASGKRCWKFISCGKTTHTPAFPKVVFSHRHPRRTRRSPHFGMP